MLEVNMKIVSLLLNESWIFIPEILICPVKLALCTYVDIHRTGVVPETAAMDATVYLARETSSNPWEAALGYLSTTARWIDDQTWFGTFQVQNMLWCSS